MMFQISRTNSKGCRNRKMRILAEGSLKICILLIQVQGCGCLENCNFLYYYKNTFVFFNFHFSAIIQFDGAGMWVPREHVYIFYCVSRVVDEKAYMVQELFTM